MNNAFLRDGREGTVSIFLLRAYNSQAKEDLTGKTSGKKNFAVACGLPGPYMARECLIPQPRVMFSMTVDA